MDAKRLRNSILQYAIQGKLVKQNPSDEPAMELLKRINPKAEIITENTPFDIPSSWCWVRLGEICLLEDGIKTTGEELPYMEAKVLRGTKNAIIKKEGKVIQPPCRVILVDGENSGEVFIINQRYYQGSTFKILKISQCVNENYLHYILLLNKDLFRKNKKGAAIPHLNKEIFSNLLIGLPPLQEQQRIVEKLEEIEPLLNEYEEKQTEIDTLYKNYRKDIRNSILQYAIQGKLVKQNPSDEPAMELLKRINPKAEIITENTPFDIPSSWCWVKVKDIFQINPKNIAEDSTPAAFIRMENIQSGYGSKFSFETVKWGNIKKGYTHFANGDIAFAKITPCFQNRKSVILCNLPNGIGAGTTELKILRPLCDIAREYVLYFCKSSYFIDEATFKGTANQQRIISGYLENKLFPLPPLQEQQRIVEKLEEIFKELDDIEQNIK